MAAGSHHSLVLTPAGCVYIFGGDPYSKPHAIDGLPPISWVSAGTDFSLFVDFEGDVWVLEKIPTDEVHYSPIKLELGDVKIQMALVSSNHYFFLLDTKGGVWGRGYNLYGQLGLGTCDSVYTPTKIEKLPKIKSLS